MALGAAPSMACDSIRLPPQSSTAIATVVRFFSAQAEQPSISPRAPAELMILMLRSGADAGAAKLADAVTAAVAAITAIKVERRIIPPKPDMSPSLMRATQMRQSFRKQQHMLGVQRNLHAIAGPHYGQRGR